MTRHQATCDRLLHFALCFCLWLLGLLAGVAAGCRGDRRHLPSVRPQLAALLLVARLHPVWPAHAAAAAAGAVVFPTVLHLPFPQAQFALDQARKAYASAPALAALLPREERLSSAGLKGFRLGSPSQCVYVDHAGRQHNVAPQVRGNANGAGIQALHPCNMAGCRSPAAHVARCVHCSHRLDACYLGPPAHHAMITVLCLFMHDRRTWTPATWTRWPCRSTTSWPS